MLTVEKLGKLNKSPAKWISIAGYNTTLTELSEIFGIHTATLRAREKAGWYLPAACQIPQGASWTVRAINQHAETFDYDTAFIQRLTSYFKRPPCL